MTRGKNRRAQPEPESVKTELCTIKLRGSSFCEETSPVP